MKYSLTFDDGPSTHWTDEVLRELARLDVIGTFFVMADRVVRQPRQIAAMQQGGHEIAFHCVKHVRHSELDPVAIERDVATGLELLSKLDIYPSLWRTPWGDVTEATRRSAAARSLNLCGWTLDSHDWRGDSADSMYRDINSEGGLEDGSVVLMHDGIGPGAKRDECSQTVALIQLLVEDAHRKGLRSAVASEVLQETGLLRGTG